METLLIILLLFWLLGFSFNVAGGAIHLLLVLVVIVLLARMVDRI